MALGLNYEVLTGDLSTVNYSSGRLGFLEFQRNLELWRWQLMIPQFCEPIWRLFTRALEIQGVDTSDVTVTWRAPRRELIDPSKELQAIVQGILGGIYTLSCTLSEMGEDSQAHLEQLAEDFNLLEKLALKLDSDPRNALAAKANEPKSGAKAK